MTNTRNCPNCSFFSQCYLIPALMDFIIRVSIEEGTDINSLSNSDYSDYIATMLNELQEYNHPGIINHNPLHEYVKSIMIKDAILPELKLPAYVLDTNMKTTKGWIW
jgi:hypothetical protein